MIPAGVPHLDPDVGRQRPGAVQDGPGQLGRIPQPADKFDWNGLGFEVMDMDGKRVDKVQVSTVPVHQPADLEKKPDQE